MKNVITLLICVLCVFSTMAQDDLSGNPLIIPEHTPTLEALYQESRNLENNGTAAQINANRLAIKNAWQEIDPNVAALYKPIAVRQSVFLGGNERYIPTQVKKRPESPETPEDWGSDLLIKEGFIDGMGMDVTRVDGHIYILAYENRIDFGGAEDSIYVYRSTDNGNSFSRWKSESSISPIRKVELMSMDGTGNHFLLAFLRFENNLFQVARWDVVTGTLDIYTISTEALDFGVDRNYPGSTDAQRVFSTYVKTDDIVYSARSTAGDYGFGWVDETSLGILGEQISFAYGRDGGCFTAFVGKNSRSLRANINLNSNDPASWGTNSILVDGSVTEVINPTIRAARLAIPNEKVVIWASHRPAGTTNHFDGIGLKRESGSGFSTFSNYSAGGAGDWSIVHTDGWIRKSNSVDQIRFSYVRQNLAGTEFSTNRSLTFNGSGFDTMEGVADPSVDVCTLYPSAIAETKDNEPCMAFVGTLGSYGFNLYFDRRSTLEVTENSFEHFKFFPNPAYDVLNVSAQHPLENISIYAIQGQKVLDFDLNKPLGTVNIENLPTGVYLMKVLVDGEMATYKFIKR